MELKTEAEDFFIPCFNRGIYSEFRLPTCEVALASAFPKLVLQKALNSEKSFV